MRKANVFYQDLWAGTISENEEGYQFAYNENYLNSLNANAISLTLPLRKEAYESKVLFPFFDGLIPEGWLLDIAVTNWKLDPKDRFGLLLTMCRDCIGAVSVIPNED
ncbi:MAG: HipA N-terminal domain-containing protein [Capnocytophaga sp.]|nr:HipA N-terminal domain-containing protein [Capnocytophaga sp.]